jgi:hypothetical protein
MKNKAVTSCPRNYEVQVTEEDEDSPEQVKEETAFWTPLRGIRSVTWIQQGLLDRATPRGIKHWNKYNGQCRTSGGTTHPSAT